MKSNRETDFFARRFAEEHLDDAKALPQKARRVRFHTIRPDQEWADKELSALDGAVAVVETQELEP